MAKNKQDSIADGIERVLKPAKNKNKWQLWEMKFFARLNGKGSLHLFQTDYVVVSPDGIVTQHRVDNPDGCLPFRWLYSFENYVLWDLTGQTLEFLKQFDGWKKRRTKLTDEELENGFDLLKI